jgi:hypothetical protein
MIAGNWAPDESRSAWHGGTATPVLHSEPSVME